MTIIFLTSYRVGLNRKEKKKDKGIEIAYSIMNLLIMKSTKENKNGFYVKAFFNIL